MNQNARGGRRRGVGFLISGAVVLIGVLILAPAEIRGRVSKAGVAPHPSALDTLVRFAEQALAQGRPWRATEIISAVLADESRVTPAAQIVAARAAAGWGGWSEVSRVLRSTDWLDSLYSGEGRALLARALLYTGAGDGAVVSARLAVSSASTPEEEGRRLVLLARALAQVGDTEGASATYLRAAALVPAASDWLTLRAAEWMADSADRGAALRRVTLPHALQRVPMVDAAASENTGDTLGAIARYTRAGNRSAALRLRLAMGGTQSDSAAVRRELLAAIGGASGTGARAFVDLLDLGFRDVTAAEDLVIARALGAGGGTRSAQSYRRALAAGLGNSNDRFQYATLLTRLGENAQAIEQFALVREPAALAAAAAYQRARTMLRADPALPWRESLRAVVRDFPSDTSAGTALYLLADLATDEGRDADARRDAFLSSARRYPGNSRAASALFHAGMISFVLGEYRQAAEDFAALRESFPASAERTAALYWRARALEMSGTAGALRESCNAIRAGDPMSYYAALCERRSFPAFMPPPQAADSFVRSAALDSIAQRVMVLRSLDMSSESNLELDRIRAVAGTSAEDLLAAADLFRELGEGSRGVAAAQAAMNAGARRDARLYRLLYPATFLDMVGVEAQQYGLDLDLIAGLIRQESLFNPAATSPAGARGLMQVMPPLGSELARAFNFPLWDPVLLYQPDVNVRMGVRHFADLVGARQHIFHVLAAYNAGAHRVDRWLTKRGSEDPEVFVDRIPFVETRDYVRIVSRNRETYRHLYQR